MSTVDSQPSRSADEAIKLSDYPQMKERRVQILPFKELLVVSIEQAVAAPYASRLFAEGGARVIKIERPEGDFARAYDTVVLGDSAFFVWLNAGKESIELDLRAEQDKALVESMLAGADVFIQNLKPGAVDRLGFGWEAAQKINPRLVMCSISGYGSSGDYAEMKAYDALIQAESGLCSVTGAPQTPSRVGISVCDIAAGLTAYGEILKALLQRHHTNTGDHVQVPLFEVMAEWMAVPMAYYKYGGRVLTGTGMHHELIAPYGAFATKNGQIFVAVQNDREWVQLCTKVLQREDLVRHKLFANNQLRIRNVDALRAELESIFTQHESLELARMLHSHGIANGRVNTVDMVWEHPQLRTKTIESDGKRSTWVRRVGDDGSIVRKVPTKGEHTDALRREFSD